MRRHNEVPDVNAQPTLSETAAMTVLSLSATDSPADAALLGGKAATLARLGAAGLPVPEGFVLTTEVFAEAVRGAQAPSGEVDLEALALPDTAAAALLAATAAWRDLPLAVRSSGVAETARRPRSPASSRPSSTYAANRPSSRPFSPPGAPPSATGSAVTPGRARRHPSPSSSSRWSTPTPPVWPSPPTR
jgi:hypothetical protein